MSWVDWVLWGVIVICVLFGLGTIIDIVRTIARDSLREKRRRREYE